MKRIIEKYDSEFIDPAGGRIYNTVVSVPLDEIPLDCDFDGLDVSVTNVIHDDCSILVRGFDKNGNIIKIIIPDTIKFFLYKAFEQGIESDITLLQKRLFEVQHIKAHKYRIKDELL
jgi:hypothetical protein